MPIIIFCGLLFFSMAAAAPMLSSKDLLPLAGVSAHKIAQLDHGEIIAHTISEASEKELAMSVALYLPVPQEKIVDYMKNANFFAIDADVSTYGVLPKNANLNDFKGFVFSAKHMEEAIELLHVEAGDSFNLSTQEIESFSALQNTLTHADKHALLNSVSHQYREILLQRWQAYGESGLKGIAEYARDEGQANPAAELYVAIESCKSLTHFFPELFHGWSHYPVNWPAGVEEYFYWINRLVENRPTAILAHSLLQVGKSGAIIVGRQYYVGHSYNSSHMCIGMLPYREGTLIYYIESTSTDQVAGIASGISHVIGRTQLKEQMLNHIKKLGKTFDIDSRAN